MSSEHMEPSAVVAAGEPAVRIGDFYLLRDGAGEMYLLPAAVLEDWRVPPDMHGELERTLANPEVSGFVLPSTSSLQMTILRMEMASAQADAAAQAARNRRQAGLDNISRLLDIIRAMNPQI